MTIMIIDMQVATPYVIAIFTVAIGIGGFYFNSITKNLSDLNKHFADIAIEITTLIEHVQNTDGDIIDIKKYHSEIIDLKVASAELNERTKNIKEDITHIQSRLDETK